MRRSLSIIAVLVPLVALHVYRPTNTGEWMRLFLEWTHVPVFVLVTIGVWHALPSRLTDRQRTGVAILVSLGLAVASEAAQIPTVRNASWEDIISDVTGSIVGLLIVFAVRRRPPILNTAGAMAAILLGISAYPVLEISATYVKRNLDFPVMFNGQGPTNKALLTWRGARGEFQPASSSRRPCLEIVASPDSRPAMDFRNMVRDWSDYTSLLVDLEVGGMTPTRLTIRVHDGLHRHGNQPHSDRFNRTFQLSPGRHSLRIPLGDIEHAPNGRSMDMNDIDGLVIFANQAESERQYRLYEIRLD